MTTAANRLRLAALGIIGVTAVGLVGVAALAPAAGADRADPPVGSGKLLLSEDFESTPVGEIPRGFTKTGAVAVVDDVAHSGKHSLRMEAAANGARRITAKGDVITALGGQHWGRLYFKVQLPVPEPQGAGKFPVIHSTLVAGSAQSPLAKDPIEVRVLDTVLGPKGTFQYIYNVQPRKRPEFGKGGGYNNRYTDEWTLAEWYVDYATQTYRLFINGDEVKDVSFSNGAGKFEKSEIPEVFESLSFGWNNYQQAGKGFVAVDRRHRPGQGPHRGPRLAAAAREAAVRPGGRGRTPGRESASFCNRLHVRLRLTHRVVGRTECPVSPRHGPCRSTPNQAGEHGREMGKHSGVGPSRRQSEVGLEERLVVAGAARPGSAGEGVPPVPLPDRSQPRPNRGPLVAIAGRLLARAHPRHRQVRQGL